MVREHPDVGLDRSALGLPGDAFVSCSLKNPNWATPQDFDVWMTLLHGVPDRVLWSLAPNEILQQNLLNETKARGIGSERLVFADRLSTPDHVARLPKADLFPDALTTMPIPPPARRFCRGFP
ncbi:hypothetical protein [Phaeobacter sp. 11ANDIMAR09]|uniref:O-linked N-acetylglucosamine transferase family protein n=1 Tax=Phaeobacter sp. 11ANDIMAR09 TaxID=1225647 RepID=UPI0006C8C3B4|nr:hypothetical protein [Phaeobacter sp. 11ANDIMAR09]KPD11879.1 hypothetical protein AN476_12920 [Phaeobacter sp. 11ANDIMAR09]